MSAAAAAGLMGAFGVVFVAVPDLLILPFQPEPDVAAVAVSLLGLAALWQIVDGVLMCNLQSLMAAGDTRFTMFAAVGASLAIQVPISALLVLQFRWGAFGTVRVLRTDWGELAVPAELPAEV